MSTVRYLDNAATTSLSREALEAMKPFLEGQYCNASSSYRAAQTCRAAIEEARTFLAQTIGAHPTEIFFTSGGTEADNWALKGLALAHREKGNHLVVSAFEHHAILETAHWLERMGFDVTYVPVDSDGVVSVDVFAQALRPNTSLASIMMANNEVGTLEPIKELVACAHEAGVLFHSDAVQAYGHIPFDVSELHLDALSVSAHKVYGPKGVGFLYRRRGVAIEPLLHGGAQERGYRAGTENVAAIVGFAQAARLLFDNQATTSSKACALPFSRQNEQSLSQQSLLRDYFIAQLQTIPHVRINAYAAACLPNIVSVSFKGVSNEALLMLLDEVEICASAGSACASGSLEPSHVLQAMGIESAWAEGTLRFSFSNATTKEELNYTIKHLRMFVERLRCV